MEPKTINKMKLLSLRNDAKMSIVLPAELKRMVSEKSEEINSNASQWAKLAMVEKLERDSEE